MEKIVFNKIELETQRKTFGDIESRIYLYSNYEKHDIYLFEGVVYYKSELVKRYLSSHLSEVLNKIKETIELINLMNKQ